MTKAEVVKASSKAATLPRKTLFSAMKNEAPFILEWVAYHRAIGFDEIVICSNPSNDGTEELLAALAAAGEIRHLRTVTGKGESAQRNASVAFTKQVGYREGDWYMWLDGDEFLNIHVGDHTVDALIAAMGDRQCALINWRVFGSSGVQRFGGRFIDPAFPGAAQQDFVAHLEQKSFFRFSPAIRGFALYGINRPLIARRGRLTLGDVAVGTGAPPSDSARMHSRWLKGVDTGGTSRVGSDEVGWALAQINHYIIRTPEFFALKRQRGRGYKPDSTGAANNRHTPDFFQLNDRNEAEDRSILRWQDRVTDEIARLKAIPPVAEAARQSAELVERVLAELDTQGDREGVVPPPAPPPAPLPKVTVASPLVSSPRKVLFSAMKNEAPFLLEWVAYHKAIGFDEIVICSNPSNDGTEEILAALAKAGEITHLQTTVPRGASPQYLATQAFEHEVGFRDGDWYLWLDGDEFLNVHVGDRSLDALIAAMGDKQIALINWRIFGASGNKTFPGRFISDDFTGAADPSLTFNHVTKAVFRFSAAVRGFARHGIHRPLIARGGGIGPEAVVVGTGKTATAGNKNHRRWLDGDDFVRTSLVGAAEAGWALAQINHYVVRTPEFFALKRLRGRGYKPNSVGKANKRHTEAFFQSHDRNEAEDRSILHWQDRVTAEIARLKAIPPVAKAALHSVELVAQVLAGLDAPQEPAAEAALPTPAVAPRAQGVEKILATAVKDEAPFLLEWLAYHKSIGFTRIVVFSNTSNDGTEELLAALADAGEITHYHVAPRRNSSPQSAAARTFARRQGYQDGSWYLWLDADEFLNIHVGDHRVDDLIAALGDRSGIQLNWRLFGSSGHAQFPGRFVSKDFPGASSLRVAANRETKTLFKKHPDILGYAANAVYRPRLAPGHGMTADDFLAGNGEPLVATGQVTQRWLAGDKRVRTNIVGLGEMGWTLAQINHYSVRTPDFFRLKQLRGRGAGKLRLKTNSRHTDEYFRRFDLNSQKDLSIARWEEAVTTEIGRLLEIPAVKAASDTSANLVRETMAKLNAPDVAADVTPAPVVADEAAKPAFKLTFPAAESAFVRNIYPQSKVILEYGSGGSTVLAAESGCRVISVESDKAWGERLATHLAPISDKAQVHYADIGRTGAWGVPASSKTFASFHGYALSVWDRPDFEEPDLVLIDGRFRASCLVAVLLRAKRPTTVLFDDYAKRRYYHGVEKLARKEEMIGRMARFTVTPGPIPPEMMTTAIGWFADPR
jgi:hypothetical protein